jgi:transposase
MSKRKKYSPEFKQGAVELTRMEGTNTSLIAKDPGIGANYLSRWIFPLLKPSRQHSLPFD